MNKNDFLSLIGSSKPVDRQVLSEISELVNIYPFFQTAHLLLLKGLKDNADIRFENQLRNSAIHIADREVLFNMLNIAPEPIWDEPSGQILENAGTGESKEEIPPENKDEQEMTPVQIVPEHTLKNEEIPVQLASISEEPEASQADNTGFEMESVGEMRNDGFPTIEPVQEESSEIIPFVEELDHAEPGKEYVIEGDLEQTVIDSAKNSEDLINEIEKDLGENSEEQDVGSDMSFTGRSILVSVESDADQVERGVIILDEEQSESEDRFFYMDPGFSVQEKEEPVAIPEPSGDESIKTLKKLTQSDLIDKFIQANPRIEPVRGKTEHPVEDLAQKFTEEKGGFITDTLARIYISQGYYSKAIDIYEKLSLKFPEKSGYFAAQIEKIKELIK